MATRVVSGIIGFSLLTAALLGPPFILMLVAFGAAMLALMEFRQAVQSLGRKVDPGVSILMAVMLIGHSRFGDPDAMMAIQERMTGWTGSVAVLANQLIQGVLLVFSQPGVQGVSLLCMLWLFVRMIFQSEQFGLEDLSMTVAGVVYIPFLLSFLAPIRAMPNGGYFIWCVVIGAIGTDTAAYFVGVTLGKHKLLPRISPKKTMEGAIGGVVGCTGAMLGMWWLLPGTVQADIHWVHFIVLGLMCGVVSQLGDWSASAIKRSVGIKDFGRLMPGHGGMMDRVDSILFVAPVVFLYLKIVMGIH